MRWGWGVAQKCDAAAAWWRAADQGLLPVDFLSHISNKTFISHFQPNFSQHLHFTSWDNNVDCCKISFRVWLICRHNNRRNSQDCPIHRHFVANEYFCQIQNAKNAVLCEAKLLHPWIMVRTFTFLLDFFQFWGKIFRFCRRSAEQYTGTDLDQVSISCPQCTAHSSHYSQCFPVSIDHHSAHSAPALYCALYLIFQNIAHNDFTMLHYNKKTDQNTLLSSTIKYTVQFKRLLSD